MAVTLLSLVKRSPGYEQLTPAHLLGDGELNGIGGGDVHSAVQDHLARNLYKPRVLNSVLVGGSGNPTIYVNAKEGADYGGIVLDIVPTIKVEAYEAGDTAQIGLAPLYDFTLDAAEGADTAAISFTYELPTEFTLNGTEEPDAVSIILGHDINVYRGVSGGACSRWQTTAQHRTRLATSYQSPTKNRTSTAQPHQDGTRHRDSTCNGWVEATHTRHSRCTGYEAGADVLTAWRFGHEYGTPIQQRRDSGWREGSDILVARKDWWITLLRDARPRYINPWQPATRLPALNWCSDWQPGAWTLKPYCWGWREGRDVYGWGKDKYTPPVVPSPEDPWAGCYTPPPGGAVPLALAEPLARIDPRNVLLNFICEASWGGGSLVIIPILKVYLTMDTASLCLLPLCTNIHVLNMTIATDADSWAWTFSAELPVTELAKVSPVNGDPAEVRATINGVQWEFIVEEISRSREFGKATLSVRGRSRTAYLSGPYAAAQSWSPSVDTLAYQLAQDALPYGYGLDWALTMDPFNEWLVTSGAWSFQGTPLDAVLDIASAVEAVVQSHKTAEHLIVGSRYPLAPWAWDAATPDYAIPLDVVRQEGMEWTEKPKYNRVFVSGETQGLVAQVTRALSAGDVVAPMAVHKALTHQYAAHERGLAILSNTGRQALVSLETALMPGIGLDVILPGKLVMIGDAGEGNWRGLVRGVEIVAGRPKVTQRLEVERHYL